MTSLQLLRRLIPHYFYGSSSNVIFKNVTQKYKRESLRQFCINEIANEKVETKPAHVPVMAKEVIEIFDPKDNQIFIDMTFGAGGHSERILQSAKNLKILTLDRDLVAYNKALELSEKYKGQIIPMLGKFSELESILSQINIEKNSVDGVLFDVGASSMQMETPDRGFSVRQEGPLDMRMDASTDQPSARDVVNTLNADDLTRIFKTYGEERCARPIAEAIVQTRYNLMEINTTQELATLVENVLERYDYDKLGRMVHSATKTFQALRIFVNNELNELDCGLELAYEYLRPGGKLIAICFHSLEDRIVKGHIAGVDINNELLSPSNRQKSAGVWLPREEIQGIFSRRWSAINKKIKTPTAEEIEENPRSRSARLRAAIKNSDKQ